MSCHCPAFLKWMSGSTVLIIHITINLLFTIKYVLLCCVPFTSQVGPAIYITAEFSAFQLQSQKNKMATSVFLTFQLRGSDEAPTFWAGNLTLGGHSNWNLRNGTGKFWLLSTNGTQRYFPHHFPCPIQAVGNPVPYRLFLESFE